MRKDDIATGTKSNCPCDGELSTALSGGNEQLCDHIGDCPECQDRLELLATADVPALSRVIRGIDSYQPPTGSALWPALAEAEKALTLTHNGLETEPEHRIDLGFLKPSNRPGHLGRLGSFEIIRVIGQGGMGVVLHGCDLQLQRDVAIKVLDPHLATNSVARQRFIREARSAAAVTHENLVTVHQVDEDAESGLPYLVMQLINGESLEQRLSRTGKLPVEAAVKLGAQAAAGLAAAHASGLIHRDIKPGNILIEADTEKVRLTDFGLARATEDIKLTRSGYVAGTPLYMAPEQARGDAIDQRADLFSLGSVLYESLAGRPPFAGRTPLAVLRSIADDRHPQLRAFNPDVPVWLESIVHNLLKKDPRERTQTAQEVAERLSMASTSGEVNCPLEDPNLGVLETAKSASKFIASTRPLRRVAAAVLAGVFVIGSALGALLAWRFLPRTIEQVEVPRLIAGNSPAEPLPPGQLALLTLPADQGPVLSVAPNNAGKMLAAGYESGRIFLWDIETQRSTLLEGHKGPVRSVSFSGDGSKLISSGDDNSVRVWDLSTSMAVISLSHPNAVRTAVIHPSDGMIVSGDVNGSMYVWDVADQKPITQKSHGATINAVAMSPDGLNVASAGSDNRIVLWDITPGKERQRNVLEKGHRGPIYGLSFSEDGNFLASAGWDGTVVIWNANTGAIIKQFKAHDNSVTTVAFSPCGGYLVTASQDSTMKAWNLHNLATTGEELIGTFRQHRGGIQTVRFFDSGHRIATGGQDGTARIWDATTICQMKK